MSRRAASRAVHCRSPLSTARPPDRPPAGAVSAERGAPPAHEGSGGSEPLIVLLVDDERPIVELLATLVQDLGYTSIVASHGQQALELARERPPALVLTDLMMPYMNGMGLVAALRAAAATDGRHAPPIILMTAAGVAAAAAVGADAVLYKPFDLDHVAELLGRYLGPPTDEGKG